MTATRVKFGAISLSSSSHLPLIPNSMWRIRWRYHPAAPSSHEAGAHRIGDPGRIRPVRCGSPAARCNGGYTTAKMTSGDKRDQFSCKIGGPLGITGAPAIFDPHIASDDPADSCSPCGTRQCGRRPDRRRPRHEHADAPHPLGLLRVHRERPSRPLHRPERRENPAASCPPLAQETASYRLKRVL